MLIDRRNIARHRPWIAFVLLATAASSLWYFASSRGASVWPGGSSPPGFTFGVVGGLLILFEFALWGRKKVRAWRIGRVQDWMIAHIWLGLLTVPLLIYHSGFRWGGSLSTVLMLLFLVVIASGVWGLWLQQILPSRMLNQVPAETIHSQINRMVRFMVDDATRLVSATCGALPGEETDDEEQQEVAQRCAGLAHHGWCGSDRGQCPGQGAGHPRSQGGRARFRAAPRVVPVEHRALSSPGKEVAFATGLPQQGGVDLPGDPQQAQPGDARSHRHPRESAAISGVSSTARTACIAGSTAGSASIFRSRWPSSS